MRIARHALLLLFSAAACNKSVTDSVEATGTLEVVEVKVGATFPGRVVRIFVAEGATVRAGDTLAILTQPTLQADQQQRQARSRVVRATLDELEHGARAEELKRAEADLAAAEADAARGVARCRPPQGAR